MENLVIKAGYLLVEFMPTFTFVELSNDMSAGKIVTGAKEVGTVIFFKDSIQFSDGGKYHLVKVEDVLAWIKPEESKADENNQA